MLALKVPNFEGKSCNLPSSASNNGCRNPAIRSPLNCKKYGSFFGTGYGDWRSFSPRKIIPVPSLSRKVSLSANSRRLQASCSHLLGDASEYPAMATKVVQSEVSRSTEDPGDWRYSVEWWGSQGGGWGDGPGETVFASCSSHGNGIVTVTSHPSSKQEARWFLDGHNKQTSENFPTSQGATRKADDVFGTMEQVKAELSRQCWSWQEEWRVLRFNEATRQSVALVTAISLDGIRCHVQQRPDCLAFSYLKTMVAAGMAGARLAGVHVKAAASKRKSSWPSSPAMAGQCLRVLCIGLGGGSLPLFLAHAMPGAKVDTVEIDPVVVDAATQAMGFPPCSVIYPHKQELPPVSSHQGEPSGAKTQPGHSLVEPGRGLPDCFMKVLWGDLPERLTLYVGDAVDHVVRLAGSTGDGGGGGISALYDIVFIDAYDGKDGIPKALWEKGGIFLQSLAQVLHPTHGTVVVNTHGSMAPPSFWERVTRKFSSGYDPATEEGRRVQSLSLAYREALLGTSGGVAEGVAYTVATPSQANVTLVVARGPLARAAGATVHSLQVSLQEHARDIEGLLGMKLSPNKYNGVMERATRGLQLVQQH